MSRIDFSNLALSSDQARAARNYFGWPQAKAAEEAGLPIHKMKRFEAGNYIPDPEFLEELRAFYEGRGYKFEDTPEPGAKSKGEGLVFPAGVVSKPSENQAQPQGNRPARASFHHMRIALHDPEMGQVLDLIDANEQAAEQLLRHPVETGIFGGLTEETQTRHAEALKLLAENGALFARLFGREIGGTPNPDVLSQKAEPKSHADLLHRRQADAHLAASGSRDAKARHQTRKPAKSLLSALFG